VCAQRRCLQPRRARAGQPQDDQRLTRNDLTACFT
jgi:hypothetical protein